MTGSNRRKFIKTAGVGAAAVGAAALVPAATGSTPLGEKAPAAAPAAAKPLAVPAAAKGAMVAYVRDVAKGEVSVMVEGREVTITDHQLVAKLANAVHSPSSV